MMRTWGLVFGWLLASVLVLSGLGEQPPAPAAAITKTVVVEEFDNYDRLDAINWAIWNVWDGELTLAKINEIYQGALKPVLLESGEGYLTWRDDRTGDDRVYLQRVDERGNRLWQHDLQVTQTSGNPGGDEILPAPGGGVYLIFAAEFEGHLNALLQRFSPQGQRMWAADVQITRPPITGFLHLVAALTPQGEVAVAWSSNKQLYLQKFTSTGGRVWTNDLKVNNASKAVDNISAFGLGAGPGGDLLAAWYSPEPDLQIMAQRIHSNGALAWEAPAVIAAVVDNNRGSGVDAAFGEDGNAYIAWVDTTDDRGRSAVFGQRLGPTGNALWSAARRLSAETEYWFQDGIHLARMGNGSLRLWWTSRHTDERNNVFWQEFNSSGTLAYNQDQVLIDQSPYPDGSYNLSASFDQSGNALVGYEYNNQYIAAQKITSAGQVLTPHPALVKELNGETRMHDPQVAAAANGDTWVLWHDSRMGPGQSYIFFQHFTAGSNRILPDGPGLAEGATNPWDPGKTIIAVAPEGKAVVAWEYFAAPDRREVRVQLLGADGTFLWGDIRLPRPATSDDLALGALEVDADGNIFVAWSSAGQAYVQKLSPDGARLWGSGVKINANPDPDPQVWEVIQRQTIMLERGQNGTLHLAWIEQIDDFGEYGQETEQRIYAQRLSAGGEYLWEEDTLVNSGEMDGVVLDKLAFGVTPDSTSVILWLIYDNASMQKLSPDGERLFAEDQPILVGADSSLYRADISNMDSSGRFYLAWAERQTGVYAQRINDNGVQLWPSDVVVSQPHPGWDYNLTPQVSAGLASASITWASPANQRMIYVNRVSQGGRRLWAEDEPVLNVVNYFFQRDGYAQSRKLNPGNAPVLAARLDADYETPGEKLRFYMSNNGGASWEVVIPFERHVFRHTGSDLRWRVGLQPADDLHTGPVVRSITITYETESQLLTDYSTFFPMIYR